LIKNLYSELDANTGSLELLQISVQIAIRILKGYFENIGSPRLLRILSDVVAVVESCLAKTDLEFSQIFKITSKENHSYTHCVNVGLYSMILASKLKMKPEFVRELGLGAMLADVGKKEIPHEILFKNGQLARIFHKKEVANSFQAFKIRLNLTIQERNLP